MPSSFDESSNWNWEDRQKALKHLNIANKEEFLKRYEFVFNAKLKCILTSSPQENLRTLVLEDSAFFLHFPYGDIFAQKVANSFKIQNINIDVGNFISDSDLLYFQCKSKNTEEFCKDTQLQKELGLDFRHFKEFFFDFQKAVKEDDRAKVASMIQYKRKGFIDYRTSNFTAANQIIQNEVQFLERYNLIFSDDLKKLIAEAKYTNLKAESLKSSARLMLPLEASVLIRKTKQGLKILFINTAKNISDSQSKNDLKISDFQNAALFQREDFDFNDSKKNLFRSFIKVRRSELKNIYGLQTWNTLKQNERMAIEDAYFNFPKLVNKNTNFFNSIKKYTLDGDLDALKLAYFYLKYEPI